MNTFVQNFDTVNPLSDTVFNCSSDTLTLIVTGAASVLNTSKPGGNISVFPNPTNDWINIQTDDPGIIRAVSVYNFIGREVIRSIGLPARIDFGGLVPSAYMVKLETDLGGVTQIVIVR